MHTSCVHIFADGYLYINLQLHVFDSSYSRNKNVLFKVLLQIPSIMFFGLLES